jgi:hypothetical protein
MRHERRHGAARGDALVMALRVVLYAALLGLPASLLVAVASGVRFGGTAGAGADARLPREEDVARWADHVLDDEPQRGCVS